MTKLNFDCAYRHMYQPQVACSYFYYGSAQDQQDHKGRPLNKLYQNNNEKEFTAHLRDVVVPLIQRGLTQNNYLVLDVGTTTQGDYYPGVMIGRKDGTSITPMDLNKLSKLLKQITKGTVLAESPHGFFPHPTEQQKEKHTPKSSYGYHRRPH